VTATLFKFKTLARSSSDIILFFWFFVCICGFAMVSFLQWHSNVALVLALVRSHVISIEDIVVSSF